MTDRDPSSHLHRLLLAGEFVVTAEMQTSDSADPAHVTELAETLRGRVDAVNCTDNSAAHAHIAPMAAARLLLDQGVEPSCSWCAGTGTGSPCRPICSARRRSVSATSCA